MEEAGVQRQHAHQRVVVVGLDGSDDLLVMAGDRLLHRPQVPVGLARDEVDEIRQPPRVVVEPAGKVAQVLVARRAGEPAVEFGVEPRDLEVAATCVGPLVLRLDRAELGGERGLARAAEISDQPLGGAIGVEELADVRDVERPHRRTLVALDDDQPLGSKPVEGLPRRRAAEPELAHQQLVVDARARLQREVEDPVADQVDGRQRRHRAAVARRAARRFAHEHSHRHAAAGTRAGWPVSGHGHRRQAARAAPRRAAA